MLRDASHKLEVTDDLITVAQRLDKHYIPTRYPNVFDLGAPRDYYTADEARQAISDAQRIYDFCQQSLR